ncbi:MAG: hypothetical protein PHV15_06580 [Thomasclavelia ramosa]|nr:hypothetical protein [Thomasclavelia ramosa]
MKKILAFFLVVVVLLGSTQLTIYADNESQGQEITTSVTNGESTKNENDSSMITNEKTVNNESTSPEKTADVKNSSITGKVKLIINTQYFKKNISTLSAQLANIEQTYTGELDSTKENSQIFEFKNIVNGTYTLTIQGDGYETVSKEVVVNNNETTVKYVNTNSVADNIEGNGFGTFAYGDFNKDGKIDSKDKKILSTAIFNNDSSNSLLDIDDNNKIDLLDLHTFTYAYSDNGTTQVTRLEPVIETQPLLVNNVSLNNDELQGTLEGKIENIFSETAQEETLKLKPEKDEEISQSNPIQMSLEVKKPVAVTQLTIQGTKENAITEGSVIVVAENGEEIEAVISTAKSRARMASRQAIVQADGSIVIDLGTQIAVKKLRLK